MAIDSAAKRHTIARFGQTTAMPGLPIPDGTISAADRAGLLWLYTGIALANVVAPASEIITFAAGIRRTANLAAGMRRTLTRQAGLVKTLTLTAER